MANCLRKFLWILTAAASSLFSLYNLRARFPEITVIRMWSIMKNQGDKTTKKMVKRDQIIKIKVQILSTCISWEIQLYLNIFSFYITCAISKKKKKCFVIATGLTSPMRLYMNRSLPLKSETFAIGTSFSMSLYDCSWVAKYSCSMCI